MTAPRWLIALLDRTAPPHRRDEVVGDLEEVHRRRVHRVGRLRATAATTVEALLLAANFVVLGLRTEIAARWLAPAEWRLAVRWLRKSPLLSATVLLALTAGITLAVTGFTITAAFLTQELPFEAGDRVVDVSLHDGRTGERVATVPELVRSWDGADVRLARLGVAAPFDVNLNRGEGSVERVSGVRLTPAGFDYVPFDPLVGRFLDATDAGRGAVPVVVLGETLWRARFDGDPGVVGRSIDLGGVPHEVVGVVVDVGFPAPASVYLPLSVDRADHTPWVATGSVLGLLAEGSSAATAESAMRASTVVEGGRSYGGAPLEVRVRRMEDPPAGGGAGAVVIGLLVGLLLVIAGNVGNLMVARAFARREELTVRAALGADRARLTAQLAAEAFVLTALATVAGLLLSRRLLIFFEQSEGDLPPWLDLGLDVRTVVFVAVVALLVTVVAGVLPALRATRVRGGAPRATGAAASAPFGWVHHAMIVTQIALAVGVIGASSGIQRAWSRGFDPSALGDAADRSFVARVEVPTSRPDLSTALRNAVAELPDVAAASVSNHTPGVDAPTALVRIEGPDAPLPVRVPVARVGDGFFDVLEVGPSAGRVFGARDFDDGAPGVAVVNEPFVRDRLGGANALGRRVSVVRGDDDATTWVEIVGVVPDLGLSGTDPARAGGIYLPMEGPTAFDLLVRTTEATPSFPRTLRVTAFAIDPDIAVESVWVVSALVRRVRWIFVGVGSTVTALGGLVLGLSLLGIYALLSFEVSRRTREIGVRVALGARPGDVMRPVLARVAGYAGAGGALGTVLGVVLGRLAQGMVQLRIPEVGWGSLAVLVGLVLVATLVAATVPTLRTLAVHPSVALRSE